jgi:hypothetical protein
MTRSDRPSPRFRVPRWLDWLLLAAGLGVLAYIVSNFPLGDIARSCSTLWPLVAVTPFIAFGWFATNTNVLYVLLNRRVPWLDLFWIRLVGDSYNALLPLAGFGGEPFKVRQLGARVESSAAIGALIRDRVVDNAMGFLVSSASIAAGLTRTVVPASVRVPLIGYAGVVSALGLGGFVLARTRVPGRVGGWLAKLIGGASPEQIEVLSTAQLVRVAAWCLSSRLLGLLEVGTLLWILGLRPDVVTVAFVDGFVNAAGSVSLGIPGGIGVLEGASVYALGVIGAPGSVGVAFAFARRGRMLLVSLFGVSLHLAHLGLRGLARRA